jgi:DNA-binding transcriptional ArsR family regulator
MTRDPDAREGARDARRDHTADDAADDVADDAADDAVNSTPAQPDPRVVGPETLKGLAHPLRMRLLTELHDRGRATATQLATALGESSGATSYHLRQLHRHGFIVEDPGGTGRERYWRPVPGGWNLPVLDLADDAATSPAVDLVFREQLVQDMERALRAMQQARSWPQPWRDSIRRMETRLSLTPDQVQALHEDLDAIIDRYRLVSGEPGSRRVLLTINTTPTEHAGLPATASDGAR